MLNDSDFAAPGGSLPRRERERIARRAEMLDAARSVLAERGFVGATLEEIAARAEYGKGTLYNYFPGGKEEILFAIFEGIYDDLVSIIDASFPPSDPETWKQSARTWFRGFIASCFAYYERHQDLFLILAKEAHRHCFSEDGERMAFFLGQRARATEALAVHVQCAIDAGAMRPFPARAVADMLFGNINGLQMHRALEHRRDEDCAMSSADFLSSFLFDGLLPAQEQS